MTLNCKCDICKAYHEHRIEVRKTKRKQYEKERNAEPKRRQYQADKARERYNKTR